MFSGLGDILKYETLAYVVNVLILKSRQVAFDRLCHFNIPHSGWGSVLSSSAKACWYIFSFHSINIKPLCFFKMSMSVSFMSMCKHICQCPKSVPGGRGGQRRV